MTTPLTALEREIIRLIAAERWPGFRMDGLQATRREDSGAGRYTYVEDACGQVLPDGSYAAQGRMIEMAGLRNGLGFVVEVRSSRISYIELFTYGNERWDGIERNWRIA